MVFADLWFLIGLFLCLVYGAMQVFFLIGVWRLKGGLALDIHGDLPRLSVVIPMRNEELGVLSTLEALVKQDYPGVYEVICIDDRSTDRTAEIVNHFRNAYPQLPIQLLQIPLDSPNVKSPKKRALALGFDAANYEILMTLDADCTPPQKWLSSMARHFQHGYDIVQGPKKIKSPQRAVEYFQALDTLGFTLIEGAFFAHGVPMLASAPSLAYRKALYLAVGGFSGTEDLESGDDDLMVQKMSQQTSKVCYNLDPHAQVETVPAQSWLEVLLQRARWSSNGAEYSNPFYVALLASVYLFFVWLTLTPVLAIFGLLHFYVLVPIGLKLFVDTMLIALGAWKLGELSLLLWYPLAQIVQAPLIAVAVPMGQLKLWKWK